MSPGWYAVVICYDIEEGLISCAEEWDEDGWVGGGRGIGHRSPEPFDSVRTALDWAYAHDMEEFGSDGWVEHTLKET